jgi:centromere protein I
MEEAVLDDATLESKLALLTFYKNLLNQWTASLLSDPRPPASATEAIVSLVHHLNNLALTIVQTSLRVKTFSIILSFYESTASLITHTSLKPTVRITIPPAELVYTLHFTNSLSTISRLCSILTLYKKAFEIAMAPKPISSSVTDQQSYHKDYVNHFNGFLMDVCNCVWRSRALNTSDPNALGCLLFPPVTLALNKYITALDNALSLASIFSFSFSPIFCLLSISYVRELEDNTHDDIERRHAGPVTQSSLKTLEKDGGLTLSWPEYKLGVLHYMENNGVNGVAELMYNTMKHLMTARDNKP